MLELAGCEANSSIRLPGDRGSEMVALITQYTQPITMIMPAFLVIIGHCDTLVEGANNFFLEFLFLLKVDEVTWCKNKRWQSDVTALCKLLPENICTGAKQFICLIKVGEQQTEHGCSGHLWEQDNSQSYTEENLWSTYWGVDYHR